MEITERVVAVALMFGLDVDEVWRPPEVEVPGEVLEFVEMRSGGVVFVTGPSGSGKSLLLGKMVEELGERMGVILLEDEGDLPGVALVDGVGESVEEACGVLARAGLAEARVMIRPPDCLSEGERYRFRLARAMARAEKEEGRVAVVADEFGSMLDRVTAVNIARRAARWAREKGVLLVVATGHDDLVGVMGAEVEIETGTKAQRHKGTKEARRRGMGDLGIQVVVTGFPLSRE